MSCSTLVVPPPPISIRLLFNEAAPFAWIFAWIFTLLPVVYIALSLVLSAHRRCHSLYYIFYIRYIYIQIDPLHVYASFRFTMIAVCLSPGMPAPTRCNRSSRADNPYALVLRCVKGVLIKAIVLRPAFDGRLCLRWHCGCRQACRG